MVTRIINHCRGLYYLKKLKVEVDKTNHGLNIFAVMLKLNPI